MGRPTSAWSSTRAITSSREGSLTIAATRLQAPRCPSPGRTAVDARTAPRSAARAAVARASSALRSSGQASTFSRSARPGTPPRPCSTRSASTPERWRSDWIPRASRWHLTSSEAWRRGVYSLASILGVGAFMAQRKPKSPSRYPRCPQLRQELLNTEGRLSQEPPRTT